MTRELHQKVLETIRRHRMFTPGDRVGAGVSGGADSVALLLLLEELREALGLRLSVVHFNHQLRGAESDADEQFVAGLAGKLGLEFFSDRADVAAAAREHGWNLEDAARRLRYDFFARVVGEGRATRLAVGHTADDQAETVLAHLLRGTGPTGLAGIHPRLGHVVRPLVEVRRQQLRDYLTARKQEWREDATNLDTTRLRSRIRQVLLPQLERDFQPAIVERLSSLAGLAREEEAFWTMLVEDRFRALVTPAREGLAIRVADLLAPLPLISSTAGEAPEPEAGAAALTRRLVRRIVEGLKGDRRRLGAQHVEQVIRLAAESTSGHRVHLPDGVVVEHVLGRLVFTLARGGRTVETLPGSAAYEYQVELPERGAATVSVSEIGRRFCLKVIDWPSAASDTRGSAEALDRDLLRPPLVLRNWRSGDAYRPVGRRRVQKLKRLLLDSRVASRERAGWPVLTSAGQLVWACGLPVAEEFAARAGTRAGLLIVEETL